MSSSIPPACLAVAAQVQEQVTTAVVHRINSDALPVVFLIWLSFGFWLGDWSNAWSEEREIFRRGFTPAGISYFCARFGGGLASFCYVLTTMVGGRATAPGTCHRTDKALGFFYCITSIGAQSAFMLRCLAVWENHPAIKALFAVLLLVIVASFILFIVLVEGVKTSVGLIVCDIKEPPKLEIIATLSTALVDIIVVGLTVFRLRNQLGQGRVHQLLFRDGIIYLLVVVAISAGLTGMLMSDLPFVQRVVLSPVHVASLSIAATRAQRALKAEGVKMASRLSASANSAGPSSRSFPPRYPRPSGRSEGGEHILGDIPEHGGHPWSPDVSTGHVQMQRFQDGPTADRSYRINEWEPQSPSTPLSPSHEKMSTRFA